MPIAAPCRRVAPASSAAMRVDDREVAIAVAVPVDADAAAALLDHRRR